MKYLYPVDIRHEDVTTRYPDGQMTLHLPEALDPDGLQITKLKRIFRIFLENRYDFRNREDVKALGQFIEDYASACEKNLRDTAHYYTQNFRNPEFVEGDTKEDRKKRKELKSNNSLLNQYAKNAQKRYERAVKIKAAWDDLTQQYAM